VLLGARQWLCDLRLPSQSWLVYSRCCWGHASGYVTYGYLPSRGWCVPGVVGGTSLDTWPTVTFPVAADVFQVLLGARYGTPVDMRPTVTFPDAVGVFQVLLGARYGTPVDMRPTVTFPVVVGVF